MRRLLFLGMIMSVFAIGQSLNAQDFSNKGKEFWLAYCYHVGMANGGNPVMTLYLTSDVSTTYQVEIFGVTTLQAGSLSAGQVVTVVIPNTYFINNEGLFTNKTIRVTSAKPVVVYSYITQSAVSGATVCLPTNVLGKEYYTMSYTQRSNESNSNSYFTIIAVEDNTTVEITPSSNTKNGWTANNTYTVALNKGQVYQVLGTLSGNTGTDLSGSKVKSVAAPGGGCKRIAVFSGSGKLYIGCTGSATSDNLYQQLYPLASWGKKYLAVPSFSRPTNYYRVAKSVPGANVWVNGVLVPPASFVNNIYYEFFNNTPNRIESDEPISVTQYFTTQGCSGNPSPYDPEMILLSPVEQNIRSVTLVSSNLVAANPQHHLHVIIKNAGSAISSFRLDNAAVPASSWVAHPQDPAYSYLYLGNVAQGYHTLSSDSGFNALAYGYANAESYGYSAGANVKDLYQFVSIRNQYAAVDFPASCKNSPFYFSMTFPYQPTQIIWDFNGLFPNDTINGPVFDSTWTVNGRQLFRYTLPNPYTIAATGTYPVRVIAQNPTSDGCAGLQEITYDLQVFDRPEADFSFSDNGCINSPVLFSDNSNTSGRPVINRFWDFGDGSISSTNGPAHTYSAAGTYQVRYSLITDVGCLSDTVVHPIALDNLPVALFDYSTPACRESLITFNDLSTVEGSALVKWYWNFGDGSVPDTSLTPAPKTHSYSNAGTYPVTLKVETTTGCQGPELSVPVIISENPLANFGFPNICLPEGAAQFSNTSTISDGTQAQLTYVWDFGDGSPSSTQQHPLHFFTGTGPYNVTLTATSGPGCVNAITLPVATIYAQARAAFLVNPENCLNDSTRFTSNSDPLPNNTIAGWFWDFNDGNSSSMQNPSHLFGSPGTYAVKHWIITDKGCYSDTAVHLVTVNPLPTADFTTTSPVCESNQVGFTDLSSANAGLLSSWAWDFGDGSPVETTQNPAHSYAAAGIYDISLLVATTKGCSDTVLIRPLTVNPKPQPGFISPEVCLNDAFAVFIDTSHIASGSVNAWLWDFGDPSSGPLNSSTLSNPQHRYNSIGNYTATLTVTSDKGCVSDTSQVFSVNGDTPLAAFNVIAPASLCANDSVAVQNSSSVNFGIITRVEIYWDNAGAPGLSEVDDLPFPGKMYKHLYPDFQSPLTKTFSIRLRAYSGVSCVNELVKTVLVHASPKVQFNQVPDICLDASPYLLSEAGDTGSVPGAGNYSGPGVSGGVFHPAAVGPGTYSILYTYTSSAAGCVDSMSGTIRVLEPPVADFSISSPLCETMPVTFSDHSVSTEAALTTWTWDFADGTPLLVQNSAAPFSHPFAGYGDYPVSLRVTTADGCHSDPKAIALHVNPLPAPVFSIPSSACLPNANVLFTNLSSIADGSESAFVYSWDFGDPASGAVNFSSAKDPSHSYASTGPFDVRLSVTSGAGCVSDTTIILNTIHPQPTASFSTDKNELCLGDAFLFSDNSDPMDGLTVEWHWAMGDGNTANTASFPHVFAEAGTYDVSLFVLNNHGCRSTTFTSSVTVHSYPEVDAGPDRFVLEGGTIMLEPVVNGNDLSFAWTPDLYFASPDTVRNPVVNGVNDQLYLLTVTGRGGCVSTGDVFVKVLRTPVVPNIFSPNGDGINDTWVIQYLESYPGCTIQIYNRYGQMVQRFATYKPWDGRINGKDAPIGTYYYLIDPKNGRKPFTGFVDIIR